MPVEEYEKNQQRQTGESLAQAILDSVDVMMAVLDADGNICAINEAWKRHQRERCTADQLERTGVGMNYLDVCQNAQGACAEEAPEAFAGIKAVLQGTCPSFILEYPCFSAISQNWYMMRVTPLPQNKGAVVAHIDITERKLFDQQKDTFISMAAHELRTPLTVLKGVVQLEKRKCEKQGSEDQRSTFVKLETHIERLSSLIAELLDVSKMQAGTLEYTEEILDLDALIQETVEMVQQAHPDHTLNIHGTPTHATLMGDRSKLNQVFTNLLNNAITYSPHADAVDISLEVARGSARVSVRDYGIGISQEHLGHIFERFYRVNISKRHHVAGLGMGLYIVQEIVKHHRGTITVTSEEGRGSTFSVLLPLREKNTCNLTR